MTIAAAKAGGRVLSHPPPEFVGSREASILAFMALIYLAGVYINPAFFGQTDAIAAILRDTARFGVMAVGMTFVIVNRDLDLSVGSTLGLMATVFSIAFAPSYLDLGIGWAVFAAVAVGLLIGLANGVLVTVLRVPAFIATLTMLFVGRGLVLGLTGGKTISYAQKTTDSWAFFLIGESNPLGFNNQILIFLTLAFVGAVVLARTRWGYETYATGGNELAASYAGIPTRRVRIRGYVLSALSATGPG